MEKYYKLIDGWQAAEVIPLPYRQNGKVHTRFFTLYPNTKYVEHIEDDIFVEKLKRHTRDIPYDADKEARLVADGVPCEVVVCKVCGGKKKNLRVNVVEVVGV